jgi:hypothetical protein
MVAALQAETKDSSLLQMVAALQAEMKDSSLPKMVAALQAEMKGSSLLQMVADRIIQRRAPPPRPRPSRAALTAAYRAMLRAPCRRRGPCSRWPRRLLPHTARVRASRRRAPRAPAHKNASASPAVAVIIVCACACSQAFVSPPGGVAVQGPR